MLLPKCMVNSRPKQSMALLLMSSSFRPATRLTRLNKVTSTPKRVKACASSKPMAPAPTTANDFGKSGSSKTLSEVSKVSPSLLAQPSGIKVELPVATMILSASISSSLTSIKPCLLIYARPAIFVSAGQLSTCSST